MNKLQASTQPVWPIRRTLLLAAMALGLAACHKPPAGGNMSGGEPTPLVPGSRFPAAVLDHIAGGNDAQGPFQGKWLVLNVWATWCPPCRREMPSLNRLSKQLDPARFAVVGLSVDADRLLASEFLMQHGIAFSNFFDPEGRLSQRLGIKVYPETFVIAPNRSVLRRVSGQQEWDSPTMVSMLEAIRP